jgi:Sec-independent protein translocase protein TatA
MHVTPLELGLAVLVVCVVFGPKRLPSSNRSKQREQVDFSSLRASRPAAGRAPSPLSRQAAQHAGQPAQGREFAMSGFLADPKRPYQRPDEL